MGHSLLALMTTLVTQVDPNQGTAKAALGAQQRIADPSYYDLVFPLIALVLVIIVPSIVALWAAWKTITDKTLADGEA
jgi:hypothetical protein